MTQYYQTRLSKSWINTGVLSIPPNSSQDIEHPPPPTNPSSQRTAYQGVSDAETVTCYKYPHGIKIFIYFSIIFANSDETLFIFIFTTAESWHVRVLQLSVCLCHLWFFLTCIVCSMFSLPLQHVRYCICFHNTLSWPSNVQVQHGPVLDFLLSSPCPPALYTFHTPLAPSWISPASMLPDRCPAAISHWTELQRVSLPTFVSNLFLPSTLNAILPVTTSPSIHPVVQTWNFPGCQPFPRLRI